MIKRTMYITGAVLGLFLAPPAAYAVLSVNSDPPVMAVPHPKSTFTLIKGGGGRGGGFGGGHGGFAGGHGGFGGFGGGSHAGFGGAHAGFGGGHGGFGARGFASGAMGFSGRRAGAGHGFALPNPRGAGPLRAREEGRVRFSRARFGHGRFLHGPFFFKRFGFGRFLFPGVGIWWVGGYGEGSCYWNCLAAGFSADYCVDACS